MKHVILDACSAINLSKAGALEVVLNLKGYTFSMGPQAQAECEANYPQPLREALCAGEIATADDSRIPAATYIELLEKYRLGEGETECITFAKHETGLIVCTDDGAARKASQHALGRDRVCGSLSLLKECVREGLLTSEGAFATYELMKAKGAYLPSIDSNFFGADP